MPHFCLEHPYSPGKVHHTPELVQLLFSNRWLQLDVRSGQLTAGVAETESAELAAPAVDHRLVVQPRTTHGTLQVELQETELGPRTLVSDEAGRQTILSGVLRRSWTDGSRFVGIVESLEHGLECMAFVVGDAVSQRLPGMSSLDGDAPEREQPGSIAGQGTWAASANHDLLHVFRFGDSDVQALSLQLPAPSRGGLQVVGSHLRLFSGKSLLTIDLAALPFAEARKVADIAFQPLAFPPEGDEQPATVVVSLANTLMLEHPRFGRVRAIVQWDDEPLQKGEQVLIDDVREEQPGVVRVYAVRRVGALPGRQRERTGESGEHALPDESALVRCPAPSIERYCVRAQARASDAEYVRQLAARHGFKVPALLARLLELGDRDPHFARWFRELDMTIDTRPLVRDWEIDPNLVPCFGDRGNVHALYIYPPWCAAGHEPPLVSVGYERWADYCGQSFAAALHHRLLLQQSERAGDENAARIAQLVALIRARLGLTENGEPEAADPPEWFRTVYDHLDGEPSVPPPKRGSLSFLAGKTEKLARERACLLHFLKQRPNADDRESAVAELHRVYKGLGWTLALENLAQLEDAYPDAFD